MGVGTSFCSVNGHENEDAAKLFSFSLCFPWLDGSPCSSEYLFGSEHEE